MLRYNLKAYIFGYYSFQPKVGVKVSFCSRKYFFSVDTGEEIHKTCEELEGHVNPNVQGAIQQIETNCQRAIPQKQTPTLLKNKTPGIKLCNWDSLFLRWSKDTQTWLAVNSQIVDKQLV